MPDIRPTRVEKPYPLDAAALTRFMAKISVEGEGCWEWMGARTQKGYGQFTHGKVVAAHRVAYKHYIGPIASGLEVDHLCRNRACVNPEHLDAVTHAENIARKPEVNATHCPRGHEFTESNALFKINSGGYRIRLCRQCRNKAQRAQRAAKKLERASDG